MSNFGALTDHFSMAETNLVLVSSTKTPRANSVATSDNENGDQVAATWYGNGSLFDAECVYALKSGTLDLSTLTLGEISTGVVSGNIKADTANNDVPKITVTGVLGGAAITAPPTKANTFELPAITLTGGKFAHDFGGSTTSGFTVGAGCQCVSSSLEFAINIEEFANGVGAPIAHGLSGGMVTMTANLVRSTDACAATGHTSFTVSQAPGATEGQAAYHTATAVWQKILARAAA